MKDFEVTFYAYHGRLRNREARMRIHGRSLEAILSCLLMEPSSTGRHEKMPKCYVFYCDKEATDFFQQPLCKEHFKKISGSFDKFMEIKCYHENVEGVVGRV